MAAYVKKQQIYMIYFVHFAYAFTTAQWVMP